MYIFLNKYKLSPAVKEILFLIWFTAAFILSVLSNYQTSTLLIKAVVNIPLALYSIYKLRDVLKFDQEQKLLTYLLTGFVVFLSGTLVYSINREFGYLKLISILLSYPALLFGFGYIIRTHSINLTKFIWHSALVIAVLIVIYINIAHPFAYDGNYAFSLNKWSHVLIGQVLGTVLVLLIAFVLNGKISRESVKYLFGVLILSEGLFFTGLRSSIIGLFATVLLLTIYFLFFNRKGLLQIILIWGLIFGGYGLFQFTPAGTKSLKRVENLTKASDFKFGNDGTINGRFYLVTLTLERIDESPIFGLGLGGFRTLYKNDDTPLWNKYPHNLFLEVQVELGIIGTLLFLALIALSIKRLSKINPILMLLYLFPVILAASSKDLSSQPLLFTAIPISLFYVRKEN